MFYINRICPRTNCREVVSLMDFTMTNKKAALELPPIELQRAIKMLSSQVSFLSLDSICVIRGCACIVCLCFCEVDARIIVTTPFIFVDRFKTIIAALLLLRRVHALNHAASQITK